MAILPFLVLLNSWQKAFAVNGTQILINISTVAQITCLHLQDLLEIILVFYFDFFSLDVEGGKLAVLQTIDFMKVFISSWQMVFISSAMLAPVLLRNTNFGNPHSAG